MMKQSYDFFYTANQIQNTHTHTQLHIVIINSSFSSLAIFAHNLTDEINDSTTKPIEVCVRVYGWTTCKFGIAIAFYYHQFKLAVRSCCFFCITTSFSLSIHCIRSLLKNIKKNSILRISRHEFCRKKKSEHQSIDRSTSFVVHKKSN